MGLVSNLVFIGHWAPAAPFMIISLTNNEYLLSWTIVSNRCRLQNSSEIRIFKALRITGDEFIYLHSVDLLSLATHLYGKWACLAVSLSPGWPRCTSARPLTLRTRHSPPPYTCHSISCRRDHGKQCLAVQVMPSTP